MDKKIQYLIADTSAFIKNAALQEIGLNIVTEQAVMEEIKNKRQLRRLCVLPYELKVQEAFLEDIKIVTEFSKKTGDYISLSATDIKVIALTYQLQREKVGTDDIKAVPLMRTVQPVDQNKIDLNPPVGFYMPKTKEENLLSADNTAVLSIKEDAEEEQSDYETAESDIEDFEESRTDNLAERFANLTCNPTDLEVMGESESKHVVDDILVPVDTTASESGNDVESIDDEDEEDNEDDDDDEDDDESGWITPGNFTNIKYQMGLDIVEEKVATVACLTMDFAMQNVLRQMGLNVVSLDGRVIKQMRTFIFRCYACFKTTSIMTKIFCPHCGNRTLKKVEVTLDENGQQCIHINFQKPLSAKGKKFSLPTPKGGKHANNPLLCEDQPRPDQRLTRLARSKNDPLAETYIGHSPFCMRDITSKSAMLDVKANVKHWSRRNPNACKKKRK